ncbi:MAG: CatB-related O-acetyltransferase [Oscillospiraceae bacterium]|nr:CatB-related O-acetyltransferase [Candidatus Equicaccousia limihippi]
MAGKIPNPNTVFPIDGLNSITFVKPDIKNPNIIVGDYTYFADTDFEKQVTHHYDFVGDRLIIGKFCQIAAGVEFVMNGANHQLSGVSTYPFYIFGGWEQKTPDNSVMPLKGDTVVGNDVWIGQNVTVMPGVHIGDGAIIGANSTVTRDIPPYTVAAGNPAKVVKNRFDSELTELLLRLCWWDLPTEQINQLIPLLGNPDLQTVKKVLKERLK